jgi:ankyrin repeat protein
VNARDNEGNTLLNIAQDIEIIRFLVSNGADIHVRNNEKHGIFIEGKTPLDSAKERHDRVVYMIAANKNENQHEALRRLEPLETKLREIVEYLSGQK